MSKEIEMKQEVLEMLKNFLMKRDGSKFKPKEIHVEMMSAPKVVGKEGLADVLKNASEAKPMEHDDHDGDIDPDNLDEGEYEEEDEPKKMSLKDFLASR